MDSEAKKAEFINRARARMHAGAKRDDVYHECSRFAVLNGLDRYSIWFEIVSSPNRLERV